MISELEGMVCRLAAEEERRAREISLQQQHESNPKQLHPRLPTSAEDEPLRVPHSHFAPDGRCAMMCGCVCALL